MSRTYRRRGELQEYRWVLSDSKWNGAFFVPSLIDARSKDGHGRRTLARFHSDAWVTLPTARRAGTGASTITSCAR